MPPGSSRLFVSTISIINQGSNRKLVEDYPEVRCHGESDLTNPRMMISAQLLNYNVPLQTLIYLDITSYIYIANGEQCH